ncbi:MAG TPA: hypothetical protein VEW03_05975 [Longimicrobiaceae bacterium]|nr:hypothetical protein [Longimicrobiaceae bacterium]
MLLRLMAEVGSAAEGEEELRRAVAVIALATVERALVEQYWKIPAYWEITLHLRPAGSPVDLFERLLGLAAAGWTLGDAGDDRWAVWNWSPGVEFLTPRIRWAELQLRASSD